MEPGDRKRKQSGGGTTASASATSAGGAASSRGHDACVIQSANSKLKLDELFLEWLGIQETQARFETLLVQLKQDKPFQQAVSETLQLSRSPALSPSKAPLSAALTAEFHAPRSPKSPRRAQRAGPKEVTRSPLAPRDANLSNNVPHGASSGAAADGGGSGRSAGASGAAAGAAAGAKRKEVIPQFFFPRGRPIPREQMDNELAEIRAAFGAAKSLPKDKFQAIAKLCNIPEFFGAVLFRKLNGDKKSMSLDAFLQFWNAQMKAVDDTTRFFRAVKQPAHDFIQPSDFKPFLEELLEAHPALEFLKATPEFQARYVETVIIRIFYKVNRADDSRLTLAELRRSNLVRIFKMIDEESDINKITEYFSYEHFYVAFCRLWELDTDHDHLIDKEDLLKYANHSLTCRIVDRIFAQAPRKFVSGQEGKMCYEDFCWFLFSEEDKTNETSLEYWFRCIDMDGDGYISTFEMEYFYEEQLHRMECLGIETVAFEDILCQILDMIKPEDPTCITLKDLKRCKLGGHVLNILFNLNKFIAYEQKDPFTIRHEQSTPGMTDWDRFARVEYDLLAAEEEEGEDEYDEDWDQSGAATAEAPF